MNKIPLSYKITQKICIVALFSVFAFSFIGCSDLSSFKDKENKESILEGRIKEDTRQLQELKENTRHTLLSLKEVSNSKAKEQQKLYRLQSIKQELIDAQGLVDKIEEKSKSPNVRKDARDISNLLEKINLIIQEIFKYLEKSNLQESKLSEEQNKYTKRIDTLIKTLNKRDEITDTHDETPTNDEITDTHDETPTNGEITDTHDETPTNGEITDTHDETPTNDEITDTRDETETPSSSHSSSTSSFMQFTAGENENSKKITYNKEKNIINIPKGSKGKYFILTFTEDVSLSIKGLAKEVAEEGHRKWLKERGVTAILNGKFTVDPYEELQIVKLSPRKYKIIVSDYQTFRDKMIRRKTRKLFPLIIDSKNKMRKINIRTFVYSN